MPGGRNGSQKWGGHQDNGMSRRDDLWGAGGRYGFRGTPPREVVDREVIDRSADGREGNARHQGPAAVRPVTLFVRNIAGRTRTVRIGLRATVADLEEAVRRKEGRPAEGMRLCAVGGAPLAARQRLTLAECGIRANSSLQLLGQLPGGGGELVLGGETYAVGDHGCLDLAGRALGPAELA